MKLNRPLFFVFAAALMAVSVVACGPPPPPDPPTNIATDTNKNVDGKLEITFEVEEKFKDQVDTIRVYRADSSDSDFTDKYKEFKLSEGTLDEEKRIYKFTFIDTNVLPGSQYKVPFFYKFACANSEGKEGAKSAAKEAASTNADSPEEVADTKVESANVEDGPQIILSWTANKEHDIKGYYVFRSETDDPIKVTDPDEAASKLLPHQAGKTLGWVDTNVTEGKPYWYVIVGVDKGDEIGKRKPATRFRATVLGKAQLTAPDDEAKVANPTFKWDPVESARGYVVVLQTNSSGGVVWRSEFLTKNEVQYPSSADPLTTGRSYYWYVYTYLEQPKDTKDVGNSRSDLRKFTVQ